MVDLQSGYGVRVRGHLDRTYMCSYNGCERDGPRGAPARPETEVGMHLNTCQTATRPAAGPRGPRTPSTSYEETLGEESLRQADRHPQRRRQVPTSLRRRVPRLGQGLGRRPSRPLVAPLTLPRQGHSHRPHHAPGRRHPVEGDQDGPRPTPHTACGAASSGPPGTKSMTRPSPSDSPPAPRTTSRASTPPT